MMLARAFLARAKNRPLTSGTTIPRRWTWVSHAACSGAIAARSVREPPVTRFGSPLLAQPTVNMNMTIPNAKETRVFDFIGNFLSNRCLCSTQEHMSVSQHPYVGADTFY